MAGPSALRYGFAEAGVQSFPNLETLGAQGPVSGAWDNLHQGALVASPAFELQILVGYPGLPAGVDMRLYLNW